LGRAHPGVRAHGGKKVAGVGCTHAVSERALSCPVSSLSCPVLCCAVARSERRRGGVNLLGLYCSVLYCTVADGGVFVAVGDEEEEDC
jgi:hypothetical protein